MWSPGLDKNLPEWVAGPKEPTKTTTVEKQRDSLQKTSQRSETGRYDEYVRKTLMPELLSRGDHPRRGS